MGNPENIAAAVAAGALTPNEARELLGLEPVTGPVLPVEQKDPAEEQGTPVAGRKPHTWSRNAPRATGLSLSNHHHHTPLKPY